MSTHDPEFYQASKFQPEYAEPPRSRGCFFYGCVIAGVGFLILAGLCGVAGFFAFKTADRVVAEYTSTEPQPLPKLDVSKEKKAALRDRTAEFRKALDEGEETPPLVLSSDDVNALIEQNTEFSDKIYITLEGDRIKGQVSLPLDEIAENLPIFGRLVVGRFLNGEAEFKASLKDGRPSVLIDSLEVNEKKLPEEMMTSLRQENLAKDAARNPENAALIRKLDSIEVKDGKLVIKARAKDQRGSDADAAPQPAEGETPKDGPSSKTEPAAKPASANPAPPKADDGSKTASTRPASVQADLAPPTL